MPVSGMRPLAGTGTAAAAAPLPTAFRWRTVRVLFGAFYLLSAATFLLLYVRQCTRRDGGVNSKNMTGLVFYANSLFAGLLLMFLAQRWPRLMAEWQRLELVFVTSPHYRRRGGGRWRLSTRLRVCAAFFLSLALCE